MSGSNLRFDFRVADLGQAMAYYSAMFGQPPSTHGDSAVWNHGGSRVSVTVSARGDVRRGARCAVRAPGRSDARRSRGLAPRRPRQHQ